MFVSAKRERGPEWGPVVFYERSVSTPAPAYRVKGAVSRMRIGAPASR
jgi:hypothetical protein